MKKVLFICTHNSARSQMAEGLLRYYGKGEFETFSAGMEATHVRPEAIAVMAEIGIDISKQASKKLDQYIDKPFDEVITVCDSAAKVCPYFPGAYSRRHWSFPDPSEAKGTKEETLQVFREIRDAVKAKIEAEFLFT